MDHNLESVAAILASIKYSDSNDDLRGKASIAQELLVDATHTLRKRLNTMGENIHAIGETELAMRSLMVIAQINTALDAFEGDIEATPDAIRCRVEESMYASML